ncbi:MAG: hypothetical protein M0Z94_18380 [Dehalococcoidales bacterium]|nr:hypothetical protein [Dehalococcoidales bacterium]
MLGRVIFGLAAGYAATATMDASQTGPISFVISKVRPYLEKGLGQPSEEGQSGEGESQESSPEKVAHRGAEMLGFDLDREQVKVWGNRVHWLYGMQWGALYTLLPVKAGVRSGLLYGAALWAGSDEMLLWILGIAKAPFRYHLSVHLYGLLAHLVYGVTLGVLARGLRD